MKVMKLGLWCVSGLFGSLLAAPAAEAGNSYSVGVEGFYENYKEPDATVNSDSYYGSLTGNYTHDWGGFFAALDARGSYGREDYKSEDGTTDGTPQWELDGRIRGGYSFHLSGGSLAPYAGVGTRYYWDEGKGTTTSLGYFGYDRHITQIYIPIGVTYQHPFANGFSIAPNIEYDQLVWGQVSSRLGTVSGYPNVVNTQHDGFGVRGNIMFGWQAESINWQAGPFIRYWDIKTSDVSQGYEEPANERFQIGLGLRAVF